MFKATALTNLCQNTVDRWREKISLCSSENSTVEESRNVDESAVGIWFYIDRRVAIECISNWRFWSLPACDIVRKFEENFGRKCEKSFCF
jgi:hypothetical protein